MDLDFAADGNLRELSGEEAWETIENYAHGQKEWVNPPNIISEQEIENLKVHANRLFGNENVWVQMHRGVDISNWEMFDDDWGLESKEVSHIGKELSLFDRPNEVERGRIPEPRYLESILQQQISQHMAPSHHDGMYRYYHPHLNSSVGEPSHLSVK
ncbi:hypothetical protein Tco_0087161 [Tanacetum coccineum]